MTQTRQNGAKVPTNSDEYNLTADLAIMGDSLNVTIPVASLAQRNALTPHIGMTVYRSDLAGAVTEVWDGARWLSSAQTNYTPTLRASTTNPSIGGGSSKGTYAINGKTMIGQFVITFGASANIGNGSYQIGLPAGFNYTNLSPVVPVGNFGATGPGSPAQYVQGLLRQGGDLTYLNGYWQTSFSTNSPISSATFPWSTGMYIAGSFTVTLA